MIANSFYTQNEAREDLEMASIHRTAGLINKYCVGTISLAEQHQLDDWIFESEPNIGLFEKILDKNRVQQDIALMCSINTARAMQDIKSQLIFTSYYRSATKFHRFLRYAVTGLIGFWLGIAVIFLGLHTTKGNTGFLGMYFDGAGIELPDDSDNKASVANKSEPGIFLSPNNNSSPASNIASNKTSVIDANTLTISSNGQYVLELSNGFKAVIHVDFRNCFPVFPTVFDRLLSQYQRLQLAIVLQAIPASGKWSDAFFVHNKKQIDQSASDRGKPGEIYSAEPVNAVFEITNLYNAENNQPAASP